LGKSFGETWEGKKVTGGEGRESKTARVTYFCCGGGVAAEVGRGWLALSDIEGKGGWGELISISASAILLYAVLAGVENLSGREKLSGRCGGN